MMALALALALALASAAVTVPARASSVFAQVPPPQPAQALPVLAPDIDVDAYRREVGRHLYAAYPSRVFRGRCRRTCSPSS